ncbi:MAG TPA: serine hydrolase [Verrucomicrobiae bacterium]|nr:serine hydrolase [Verrucomicrobiae bacterium]
MSSAANSLNLVREKTGAKLREIAGRTRGAFGFMAVDLASGEQFALNEHTVFPQASAIKIPILMEVYKQAGEGRFALADLRRIEKADKTPGSGILSELGDGTVEMSLHDLCVLMILVSDNTATNMLIDLVGMENVNRTLQSIGLKQTSLQRRMMDMAACARGEENLSTPFEAARIMELLHRGEFINRSVCDEILAILKKPKSTAIASGLPEGTPIASKPGGIAGVKTEWAIVQLKERPYVLTVMESYGLGQEAPDAFKEISKALYEYFSRLGHATNYGAYIPPPH